MDDLRRRATPVVCLITLCLLTLGIYVPAAQAALIGTEDLVTQQQATQDRDHIRGLLQREGIRAKLEALGIDPAQAEARMDSLTDAEVKALAGKLDSLPAGGDEAVAVILIILVALVITDILGYTKFFTFTRESNNQAK